MTPDLDWLDIGVRPGRGWLPRSVVFAIDFRNRSEKPRELRFFPWFGKPQWMEFAISDGQGHRLEPVGATSVRTTLGFVSHVIKPQGRWTYKLRSSVRDGALRFSRVRYELGPGSSWHVWYNHAGVCSPQVPWRWP